MYEIRYLPLARKDLADIISYIAEDLKAPKAAMDLLDSLDKSISGFGQFLYSYEVYQPIKALSDDTGCCRSKIMLSFM